MLPIQDYVTKKVDFVVKADVSRTSYRHRQRVVTQIDRPVIIPWEESLDRGQKVIVTGASPVYSSSN